MDEEWAQEAPLLTEEQIELIAAREGRVTTHAPVDDSIPLCLLEELTELSRLKIEDIKMEGDMVRECY